MRATRRLTALRVEPLPAMATALVVVAASTFGRIFGGSWKPSAAIATVIACGVVGTLLSRPVDVRLRALIYGIVVLAGSSVAINRAGGTAVSGLFRSLTRGGGDILSSRWPVAVSAPAVGLLVLVSGAAAAVNAELARRRVPGPALLIAPTALLVLMAILAAPAGPPSFLLLSIFVAVAALVLRRAAIARQAADDPNASGRAGQSSMVVGAIAAMLALVPAVAAGLLIDERRYDPRDQRNDRPVADEELSPLARVDEWKSVNPPVVLFESTGATVDRWRLVSLPRYNGRVWSPAADVRKVGARLDGGRPPSNAIEQAARMTVRALDGRWLPIPVGIPKSTDRVVRTDALASGLLAEDPLRDGDRYQAAVWSPIAVGDRLDRTPADPTIRADLRGVAIPTTITSLALDITAGAKTDREKAERLATYLRDKYRLDETAPVGHSLAILQLFLERTRSGRSEQFVAGYSLLAAAAGLPVRLTVGFDGRQSNGQVTTADAAAWPEVAYAGIGWVPVDPLPSDKSLDVNPKPPTASAAKEQAQAPPTTAPRNDGVPSNDRTPPKPEPSTLSSGVKAAIGIPLGFIALCGCYVAAVLAAKRRRRQVDADAPAHDRVVESFLLSTDLMLDMGLTVNPAATNRELIHAVSKPLPAAEGLLLLAETATRASYSSGSISDEQAAQVVADAERFREIAKSLGPIRWWRARLSLRSLRSGLRRH